MFFYTTKEEDLEDNNQNIEGNKNYYQFNLFIYF